LWVFHFLHEQDSRLFLLISCCCLLYETNILTVLRSLVWAVFEVVQLLLSNSGIVIFFFLFFFFFFNGFTPFGKLWLHRQILFGWLNHFNLLLLLLLLFFFWLLKVERTRVFRFSFSWLINDSFFLPLNLNILWNNCHSMW
jgi:hypothetical protein